MAREAKSFSEMLKEKLKKGPLGKVAASFRKLKYKRSDGAPVKTETSDKKTGSVVKKRNYFKIGFYSFGVAFIVIGIIYILILSIFRTLLCSVRRGNTMTVPGRVCSRVTTKTPRNILINA